MRILFPLCVICFALLIPTLLKGTNYGRILCHFLFVSLRNLFSNTSSGVWCESLKAVSVKSTVFWVMTPCSLVKLTEFRKTAPVLYSGRVVCEATKEHSDLLTWDRLYLRWRNDVVYWIRKEEGHAHCLNVSKTKNRTAALRSEVSQTNFLDTEDTWFLYSQSYLLLWLMN
jgi:hypothetical protein